MTESLEIIRNFSKKVKKEHIDSFYRTGHKEFIIVLKTNDLKDFYTQELVFREKILDKDHNFQDFPFLLENIDLWDIQT